MKEQKEILKMSKRCYNIRKEKIYRLIFKTTLPRNVSTHFPLQRRQMNLARQNKILLYNYSDKKSEHYHRILAKDFSNPFLEFNKTRKKKYHYKNAYKHTRKKKRENENACIYCCSLTISLRHFFFVGIDDRASLYVC